MSPHSIPTVAGTPRDGPPLRMQRETTGEGQGNGPTGDGHGEETRDVAMELTTSMLDVSTSLPLE